MTTEPTELPFGMVNRVDPRNCALDGRARWCHLANTAEWLRCRYEWLCHQGWRCGLFKITLGCLDGIPWTFIVFGLLTSIHYSRLLEQLAGTQSLNQQYMVDAMDMSSIFSCWKLLFDSLCRYVYCRTAGDCKCMYVCKWHVILLCALAYQYRIYRWWMY